MAWFILINPATQIPAISKLARFEYSSSWGSKEMDIDPAEKKVTPIPVLN